MASIRVDIAPDKQAIKAADRALIRAAGGVEAAAFACRVSKSVLSEYGRPDNECFMPGDVRADLEAITHGIHGHPIATRHAARALGYALVKLTDGETPTGAGFSQALCDCIRDSGELHAAMAEALGDGRVSKDEAAKLKQMAIESAEEKMRLIAMLDQVLEG